ncbi:MAG: TetR/AcrR family transcriptional regulator [Comamonas sp.]|uniref:TetR/AcrR family transcriptional regulator n=1 Tax=Comamonas TaxID=283 RepID=UPI002446B222|nr:MULTISPECIES: TetR/AcrR family transcriptional regulator [Comamonas]MDH1255363.1 TetR/AcrR family transcriptional regulator [Comamonas thiooxydans]MDN5504542.1 TetR/AcrR family transcriptional regulator [Comamonas sp.]MDN5536773.1 TetR/AcrR family transcriptional regulator [Comamonas sp.]
MSIAESSDNRYTRKTQKTVRHLATTAFDLFERDGYAQVTMEQIAAAADVAKGTLYKHFPNKEAVLAHCLQWEIEQPLQDSKFDNDNLSCQAQLRTFFHLLAQRLEARKAYIGPYLKHRMSQHADTSPSTQRKVFDATYRPILEHAQATGQVRTDLPIELLLQSLKFLQLSTLIRWLDSEQSDLKQEFELMLQFFFEGARGSTS